MIIDLFSVLCFIAFTVVAGIIVKKGIGKKVSNIVRSASANIEESMSDPKRDGKIAIIDAKKKLETFSSQISSLKTATIELENKQKDLNKKITNMGKAAEAAAAAGNEVDVKDALLQKNKFQAQLDSISKQIIANKSLEDKTVEQRRMLQDKIETAENNLEQLVVRDQAAGLRADVAKSAAGLASSDAFGDLDALDKMVAHHEAEAEAIEELAATSNTSANLETKYNTQSSDVDDEVAALMAKHSTK